MRCYAANARPWQTHPTPLRSADKYRPIVRRAVLPIRKDLMLNKVAGRTSRVDKKEERGL